MKKTTAITTTTTTTITTTTTTKTTTTARWTKKNPNKNTLGPTKHEDLLLEEGQTDLRGRYTFGNCQRPVFWTWCIPT